MMNLKMDLHIHTPASKCYLEEDNDETYYNILKQAVAEKIDIIAITDHNTIDGYKHFFTLKENLLSERKALLPYSEKATDIAERINQIDQTLLLYESVWIIAGVEITLNPGIHMLVLADDSEVNDLSLLLDEVGYSDEKRGADSDYLPNIDVKMFLENNRLRNKIVIAPHVDSDKGIYNVLTGMYRAEIFKNANIHAISCNGIKQLDKIQNLVKNDPNYKRDKIWAYINASDAHRIQDIGNRTSYAKIQDKKFRFLMAAFENSGECISDVENQEVAEMIERLIKSQKFILLKDIEQKPKELAEVLCASLNSDYHGVILGVSGQREILGINVSETTMESLLNEAFRLISYVGRLKVGAQSQNLGNGRQVYLFLNRERAKRICYIKPTDEVFVFDKVVRKASVGEIEKIIRIRLLNELDRFQQKDDETIEQLQYSLYTLQQPIGRYKLAVSIEEHAESAYDWFDAVHVEKSKYNSVWDELQMGNGMPTGEIYYAQCNNIRLEDAVLRYTCPRTNKFINNEAIQRMKKIEGACIVITEQGGAYIIDTYTDDTLIDGDRNFILLKLREEYKELYSLYSVAAWFKSSVFIWYMQKITGSLKLYEPSVYAKIVIPCVSCMNQGEEIERVVKEIIQLENEFLEYTNRRRSEAEENNISIDILSEEMELLICRHNEKVAVLSKQIDEILINALSINDKLKEIIIRELEVAHIYNYLS